MFEFYQKIRIEDTLKDVSSLLANIRYYLETFLQRNLQENKAPSMLSMKTLCARQLAKEDKQKKYAENLELVKEALESINSIVEAYVKNSLWIK